jgi:hypothetical protein
VSDLTHDYADKLIGDRHKDLKIKFSGGMRYLHGYCYAYKPEIVYNDRYMDLNKSNDDAIRHTVIEECAHLVYPHHTKDFFLLCKDLGLDVRRSGSGKLYIHQPESVIECSPRYKVVCPECKVEKYYYHYPRSNTCKCGSGMPIHIHPCGWEDGVGHRARRVV